MNFTAVLFLCAFLIITSIAILVRNKKVFNFLIFLNHGTTGYLIWTINQYKDDEEFAKHYDEYNEVKQDMEGVYRRYSYEKLLFSFLRPLKLESWFSSDEVEKIRYGFEYYEENCENEEDNLS